LGGGEVHKVGVGNNDDIFIAELGMSRSFGDFLFKDGEGSVEEQIVSLIWVVFSLF